ncbi:MAG: hypothetical protein Q7K45_03115 [Nanoarchaeota archaeon]|nr:hypothetical protein [Nanoarchaeota archaeon]
MVLDDINMATHGNLELRLNESSWYASTTHDGYRVYEAVPQLVKFLDSVRDPTKEQFEKWFRSTSKKLLPCNYGESLMGGVPSEVIMDIPRRLILHTGNEDDYRAVSKRFLVKFENAGIVLKAKYDFEILNYVRLEVRKDLKVFGSE